MAGSFNLNDTPAPALAGALDQRLAERLRAGGYDHAAFLVTAGVEEGECPIQAALVDALLAAQEAQEAGQATEGLVMLARAAAWLLGGNP